MPAANASRAELGALLAATSRAARCTSRTAKGLGLLTSTKRSKVGASSSS